MLVHEPVRSMMLHIFVCRYWLYTHQCWYSTSMRRIMRLKESGILSQLYKKTVSKSVLCSEAAEERYTTLRPLSLEDFYGSFALLAAGSKLRTQAYFLWMNILLRFSIFEINCIFFHLLEIDYFLLLQ